MTRKDFEAIVVDAIRKLPPLFRQKLENVDFVIEDRLDLAAARKRGLRGRGRILGLYEGVPLSERTHYYGMVMPDKITLFKEEILTVCEERRLDVRDEVRHVIEHEVAHHFGISDARLDDLGVY